MMPKSPDRPDTAPGLRGRAWNGVAWTSIGSGLQAVTQIAVLAVLARLLTPLEFGTIGAAMIVVSLGALFSQLGVGPALVQRPVLTRVHLAAGFTLSILCGLLIGLAVWLAAGWIEAFFQIEGLAAVVRVMALAFPLKGISIVSEALLQRDLRFRTLATNEFASYAAGYGLVGIALAVSGLGVWALVGALLAQSLVRSATLVIIRPPVGELSFALQEWRDLLGFAAGHTAGTLGGYLSEQADNIVVGRWLGAPMLGVYGRAFQFLAMPARLFGIVADRVLFPVMAKARENRSSLGPEFGEGLQLIALATIPVGIAVCLAAPEIVSTILGPGWEAVVPPLQFLALSLCFRTGAKLSKALARAVGAVYETAWRQWVFAGAVMAGALFGKTWGVAGVAAGVLLANAGQWLAMLQLARRLAGVNWSTVARAHVPACGLALAWTVSGLPLLVLLRGSAAPAALTLASVALVWAVLSVLLILRRPQFFLGAATAAQLQRAVGRRSPLPGMAQVGDAHTRMPLR